MRNEIDFLKGYERRKPREQLSQFSLTTTVVIFVIYILACLGVLAFGVFLRKTHQELNSQIKNKTNQINQMKNKEFLQNLIKQRISLLAKIKPSKEKNFYQLLNLFTQLSGEAETVLADIKIFNEGKSEIKGKTPNSVALFRFLEKITNPNTASFFSNIVLNSLNRSEDGSYNFQISFTHDKL